MRIGVRTEPRKLRGSVSMVADAASPQAIDAAQLNRFIYPTRRCDAVAVEQQKERPTMRTKTAGGIVPVATPVASSARLFHCIVPPVVIVIGLVATLAWTALLGYGLVNAVALAF